MRALDMEILEVIGKGFRRGGYIILLCAAVQAAAQGCESNFDNELRFGAANPEAVDSFAARAAEIGARIYDGSVGPPANVQLTSTNANSRMHFDVGAIDAQSKDIRLLFRDVIRRSHADDPEHGREFGAALLVYADGTTIVAKFTSNRRSEIVKADVLKAIFGAADHARRLVRLLVLHTHPMLAEDDGEIPEICPSSDDFDFLDILQKSWEATHDHGEIEVEGVVLPINATCSNVFFRFYPGWLAPKTE